VWVAWGDGGELPPSDELASTGVTIEVRIEKIFTINIKEVGGRGGTSDVGGAARRRPTASATTGGRQESSEWCGGK
jgi:hypothetical protein